ncbi:MAG TPA: helix-turn-helix domain-containing protein [Anaerolineaceae bacterium]|nr:helix-turn-helix domain-containing protein [Anaerolineaceae bacterium]
MQNITWGTKFLTIPEVAEALQVSHRTVFRWMSEGLLPVVRVGKITRIRQADMEAFLQAHLTTESRLGQGGKA